MRWELIQTGHQWNKLGVDVELRTQKWGFGLKISYLSSSLLYSDVEFASTDYDTENKVPEVCVFFQNIFGKCSCGLTVKPT